MAFAPDYVVLLDRLDDELQAAPEAARAVFARIIGSACSRIPVLSKSGKTARMERLIESGAWTDAAMALVESEMPGWKLRRLVYENGEWFCSLSRQPNMPADLDDRRCAPGLAAGDLAGLHRSPTPKQGCNRRRSGNSAAPAGRGRHGLL